jgi:hypothetical protein
MQSASKQMLHFAEEADEMMKKRKKRKRRTPLLLAVSSTILISRLDSTRVFHIPLRIEALRVDRLTLVMLASLRVEKVFPFYCFNS